MPNQRRLHRPDLRLVCDMDQTAYDPEASVGISQRTITGQQHRNRPALVWSAPERTAAKRVRKTHTKRNRAQRQANQKGGSDGGVRVSQSVTPRLIDTDLINLRPNPALRKILRAAGFDLNHWSDRHLVLVQLIAGRLSQGERVFVSSEMQPLIDTLLAKAAQQQR